MHICFVKVFSPSGVSILRGHYTVYLDEVWTKVVVKTRVNKTLQTLKSKKKYLDLRL